MYTRQNKIEHNCAQPNYFRFAAAIFETDGTRLGQSQTVGIHPQNTSDTQWRNPGEARMHPPPRPDIRRMQSLTYMA